MESNANDITNPSNNNVSCDVTAAPYEEAAILKHKPESVQQSENLRQS